MDFETIWKRIKNETEIKKFNDLAVLVGKTQQNISARKKQNFFPVEWAYLVAKEYNLSTEWIMTGKGPKKLANYTTFNNEFLALVDEWLTELIKKEPQRAEWFRCQFEDSFPGFKDWIKRRETQAEGEDNTNMDSKVA